MDRPCAGRSQWRNRLSGCPPLRRFSAFAPPAAQLRRRDSRNPRPRRHLPAPPLPMSHLAGVRVGGMLQVGMRESGSPAITSFSLDPEALAAFEEQNALDREVDF